MKLKLPFEGKLKCSQENNSGSSHSYTNTKYALDFSINGKKKFKVLSSADGISKIWRCCSHKSGNCKCGLGFGNQIRIYHNGFFTFYAHLNKILIKNNQKVKQGQVIGIAGKTGLAGNIHLHWTLGKEARGKGGKFIPFYSVKSKLEIKDKGKIKAVSSTYFRKNKVYISTNQQL